MKQLLLCLMVLSLVPGLALADEPQVTTGTPGEPIVLPQRDDVCQYGFTDTSIGSGWSLNSGQQLGIECVGPMTITGVGYYSEFIVTPGNLDIVIFDDGTEVSRTTVYVDGYGVLDFDIPDVAIAGDACIMLCPITYYAVTGEDYASPPYGNSYWSTSCTCQNAFTDNNLTIWATYLTSTPVEEMSWGRIRSLYR